MHLSMRNCSAKSGYMSKLLLSQLIGLLRFDNPVDIFLILPPTAGKVLASIILNRIKEAVDRLLRQEQAGFRKSRSCCEQVFALRQIIEKVQALEKSVYLNFIDFKKPSTVYIETLCGRY